MTKVLRDPWQKSEGYYGGGFLNFRKIERFDTFPSDYKISAQKMNSSREQSSDLVRLTSESRKNHLSVENFFERTTTQLRASYIDAIFEYRIFKTSFLK